MRPSTEGSPVFAKFVQICIISVEKRLSSGRSSILKINEPKLPKT